jgi:energy-coupling factor transport system substrate-specific component
MPAQGTSISPPVPFLETGNRKGARIVTASTLRPAEPRQATDRRWRVVDLVVASVLAVACGALFLLWNIASTGPINLLTPVLPGLQGLANGPWLLAGPLVGLVVRKPGAAVYGELVAAAVELLILPTYGPVVLLSGLLQGLGAEVVFALVRYRRFGVLVGLLAGAAAGVAESVLDLLVYYPGAKAAFVVGYSVSTIVSGAAIGVVAWLLVRALAATGVLDRFAAGRSARRLV